MMTDITNVFDFVNSVTYNKNDLYEGEDQRAVDSVYVPFVVNRSLSQFSDSIMYANMVNQYPMLDNKLQYYYLLNSLRKRKRFSKWAKRDDNEDISVVQEYFGYGYHKAKSAVEVLTPQQLEEIKNTLIKGGVGKNGGDYDSG